MWTTRGWVSWLSLWWMRLYPIWNQDNHSRTSLGARPRVRRTGKSFWSEFRRCSKKWLLMGRLYSLRTFWYRLSRMLTSCIRILCPRLRMLDQGALTLAQKISSSYWTIWTNTENLTTRQSWKFRNSSDRLNRMARLKIPIRLRHLSAISGVNLKTLSFGTLKRSHPRKNWPKGAALTKPWCFTTSRRP